MKLIRNAFAVSLLAAASVAACSSQHGTTGTGPGSNTVGVLPGQGASDGLGTVGMHLQIANGVLLQNLTWTISGTGLPSYNGSVPIGDAQSIEFIAGGIQAGGPYTITLTGTDNQADPCTGSATFSIVAGATSSAVVIVTCTQPADAAIAADVTTGNLAIDAGVVVVNSAAYHCPGISAFSINPAEVLSPQTASLQISEVVTPGGTPGNNTITWTASNGTFTDTNSTTSSLAAPTFSCGAFTGVANVTVTIAMYGSNNGVDAGNVCATEPNQTFTGQIVCDAGGQLICSPPTSTCGTGASAFCTNVQTDSLNCGTCGTVCPAAETCQAGTCACPTAGQVLCGATCTSTATDVNNCGTCGNVCATGDTCSGGTCQVPAATICTVAPCAANTITCAGLPCTATEAVFAQIDVTNNVQTTAGDISAAGGCYTCLVGGNCLDTTHVHTRECGDLTGNFGAEDGGVAAAGASGLCMNTLSCVVGNQGADCSANSNGPSFCFCGTNGGGPSSCAAATNQNGPCQPSEIAGFKYDPKDGTDIIKGYDDTTQPSGLANQIIACALSNTCTSCLQP